VSDAVTPGGRGVPTGADIASLPKVLLHDHLDGGVRPATVIELADASGGTAWDALPAHEPDALADWFVSTASRGSLEDYLTVFEPVVAVLQTPEAVARVAAEAVLDVARDGVVHAELRYAPTLSTRTGLPLNAVVEALVAGLRAGTAVAASEGMTISTGAVLCGLRHLGGDALDDVADAAIAWLGDGVVGFDLAGPEQGYPASRHAATLARLRAADVPLTLHAGEGAGAGSVADAVAQGARRLGHGVRVLEDRALTERVAALGLACEVSPTSNLQTGLCTSYADHPFEAMRAAGLAVTVNTDNRTVGRTSLTAELGHLVAAFGYRLDDLYRFTMTAVRASFAPDQEKLRLAEVVGAGYGRGPARPARG
jgi:adenosine deaminase